MEKKLCVTSDFWDDLLHAGRHFERHDLDAMMQYAASLKAERFEWVLDTVWTLYNEDSPVGFDLLYSACEAAHRYNMRFDVVFKPFEGALKSGTFLPTSFPPPGQAPLLEEPDALLHAVRPFVADHPHMRIGRAEDDAVDPGGGIRKIKLVKNDDSAAPFGPDDFSIWTSTRNGGFQRYNGPVFWSETLEWRPNFPYDDRECRIINLNGLEIPEQQRFILLRCESKKNKSDFANSIEKIVELESENGNVIPSMPSRLRVDGDKLLKRARCIAELELTNYLKDPQVRNLLKDRDRFLSGCEDMFKFAQRCEDISLVKTGELAVARGKSRYISGALHPLYPEVRENWLEHVKFCVDRGVDGVNIRIANHNRSYEPWAHGFNEAVLQRTEHRDNIAEVRRINGQAYTQFLREARELLHAHERELGVHLNSEHFRHDDRSPFSCKLPRNFDWQWELWLREIADYVEFRGAFTQRPENLREVTDRIGLVAREAGIPFIFQSNRGSPMHFKGPHHCLAEEMNWVRSHPDVTEYNLYETANFSRIGRDNRLEGSKDMAALVDRCWWKNDA